MDINEYLNSNNRVFNVIGSLANNPKLIVENADILNESDYIYPFQKDIIKMLKNIYYTATNDLADISANDLESEFQSYPQPYAIWQAGDGYNYIEQAKANANEALFKSDLEQVRKLGLLRKYWENGIDVDDLTGYSLSMEEQTKKADELQDMSINDIINHYSNKTAQMRDEYNQEISNMSDFTISDDIDSLFERLQEEPEMGYPLQNPYYNTLFRGMREGKYLLRSMKSGGGKTRSAMRDFLNVATDELYNIVNHQWEPTGTTAPTLFISTELDKDELQTIALGYLTGLGSGRLSESDFTDSEIALIRHGMDVLKRSQAYFVYIEDFDENDVESIIDEYVTRYGVQYVNFDYIQMTPKLSSSSKDNYGRQLREDEILSSLSRKLKQMATKYEIFIMSATQLNDNGNNEDNNYNLSRTERAIRGSKAVVDKVDYGVIGSKLEERDLNKINQLLIDKYQLKATQMTPNYAHFIYKNRAGLNGIILWTQFDQGNLRENTVLVTDYDLNELDITPLEAIATQEETEVESNYTF